MLYYLKHSIDRNIIGNCSWPQIQDFDMSDLSQPKYLNFDIDGLLPSNSKLPRYKLQHYAKITDLISSSQLGSCLIISNTVVDSFEHLNLPLHQYFDFSFVSKKNEYNNYKAFYIARDPQVLDMIDWERSEFLKTTDYHKTIIDSFKFTSWEEMIKFDKVLWDGDFSLLRKLKINYSGSYDLIKFNYFGFPPGFICTEKAKNLIEENGFTGFLFDPVEEGVFI